MKFEELWNYHPNNNGDSFPCRNKDGEPAFENQCAIRMGIALEKAGMSLASYKGERCWHGHKPAHILRAEELAKWLKPQLSPVSLKVFSGDAYKNALSYMHRKRGIVFYKNFFGAGNQGDHIDLWNQFYATKEVDSFFGALFPSFASYNKAEEIWF